MARSTQRKIDYNSEYTKENYHVVKINIRKDSGIIESLEDALSQKGISRNAYISEAIQEKINGDKEK